MLEHEVAAPCTNSAGMTPKDRAIWALECRPPIPGLVPTFELEFQLGEELLGRDFYRGQALWDGATATERDRMIRHNGDLYIEVAERLDHAIIMIVGPHDRTALCRRSTISARSATAICSSVMATPPLPSPTAMT
ncbi:MAG: hypothetical protein R2932_03855 [Caldilineaceae bacterium]